MKKTSLNTRFRKRLGALILSIAVLTGILALTAAALEPTTLTVELRPSVTITVDGAERNFYNAQGQEVHAILYNGTHYLPVRAIGELMGKNVNWDSTTKTITLTSPRTAARVSGTPDASAVDQTITAQLRPDFTIVVDGVKRNFTDAQGRTVYPLLYSGTNYLPVRAIGELMGKTVDWNDAAKNISLDTPVTGGLVTDADTFGPTGGSTGKDTTSSASTPGTSNTMTFTDSTIGEEQAKSIALAEVPGATEDHVRRVKLDRDDGRWEYDVEIVYDYREYEFEIDAYTGAIRDRDADSIFD